MNKGKALLHKIKYFIITGTMAATCFILSPKLAFANQQDGWKKAGITPEGSLDNPALVKDLNSLVNLIMIIGGFWVISWLLFAGMRLASSQGNPQNRTQGFIGLAMAALGLFIIVKAYDIAGWVAGFGSN